MQRLMTIFYHTGGRGGEGGRKGRRGRDRGEKQLNIKRTKLKCEVHIVVVHEGGKEKERYLEAVAEVLFSLYAWR